MDEGLELSLATHSARNLTLCLTAFAQLAFVRGEGERAALLAGAAEGLRQRVGLRAWPLQREGEAQLVAHIRQALGAERFDQGFAAGVRLNRRQAIAASATPAAPAPQPPEMRSVKERQGWWVAYAVRTTVTGGPGLLIFVPRDA